MNKGFMMAEVVVVSSIVLVALVGLYTSYSKIFTLYNQRVNYYDIRTLYELSGIRDHYLDAWGQKLGLKNVNGDIVLYVKLDDIKDKTVNVTDLKQTFKDYLDFLATSLDFNNIKLGDKNIDKILIMENCDGDENNCKYAYLEVPND